ncbi:MAG: cobalamin-dependent protein [Rhodobacterales bacterium]|nr:cobalamin-dependent protein [Rhodobacterales bacterium]
MSEDHGVFSGQLVPPLLRAKDYMERRGQALPPAALRLLAREVILRVGRASDAGSWMSDPALSRPGNRPSRAEIELLADALLNQDDDAGADLVREARQAGMPAETLYHHYIAQAVRRFGERWESDEATAAQVILGAGRVYAILRDLRSVFLAEHLVAPPGAEAVFATVPGEVHGLGVTIAADTMRLRGWDISLRVGLGHEALVEEIARLRPTMVGLSASLPSHTLPVARLIVALRVRCPHVWIMLAGGLVAQDPGIAVAVDADAGVTDVESGAARLAEHLAELNRLTARQA